MWKKLDRKVAYENKWLQVFEDKVVRPDGNEGIYGFMNKKDGVRIVAVDTEGRILLNLEHRYPVDLNKWELPAGVENPGEEVVETAKRELMEETGYESSEWSNLGKFAIWPGYVTTFDYGCLAKNVSKKTEANLDGDEAISKSKFFSKEEIVKMIDGGEIICSVSIAFILKYLNPVV